MSDVILTKRQKIRRAVLRFTGFLCLIVPAFFAVSALGSRFGLWSWEFGLGTLTRNLGMKALFLLLGFGVICLALSLFIKPRKGLLLSLVAIIIPVAGMAHGAAVVKKVRSLPFIHDVSTDTQNPPGFTSAIATAPDRKNSLDYVNKTMGQDKVLNSVLQVQGYKDIRPVVRSESPDVLFDKAVKSAKSCGWVIVKSDKPSGTIEATDTTFWFGFKDDVSIRIVAGKGGGSVLDIRSVSRVGGSDIGANAARIKSFIAKL